MSTNYGRAAAAGLGDANARISSLEGVSYVSICKYGAAEGIDNTEALTRAFNSGEHRIFVPPGEFEHSGVIYVDSSNVEVFGIPGASHLLATDAVNTGLYVRDSKHVTVRGLTLRCDATKRMQGNVSHKLTFSGCENCRVDNVEILGSSASGIFIYDSKDIWVSHNKVLDTLADGIHVTRNSRNIVIDGNIIRNTGDDGVAIVSYLEQGSRPEVSRLKIEKGSSADGELHIVLDGMIYPIRVSSYEHSSVELLAEKIKTQNFEGWEVSGSGSEVIFKATGQMEDKNEAWVTDNGTGVEAEFTHITSGNGRCYNITARANQVFNSKARGMTNVGGAGVIFSDNIVDSSASSCYLIFQDNSYKTFSPLDTIVTNNIARNAGKTKPTAGNKFGFEVQSGAVRVLLSGNTAMYCESRGFSILGSNHLISDNRSYRNYTSGFSIEGDGHQLNGNTAEENGEYGFGFIRCSKLTVISSSAINNNTKRSVGVDNWSFNSSNSILLSLLRSVDTRTPDVIRRTYEFNNCSDFTISSLVQYSDKTMGFSGTNSDIFFSDGVVGDVDPKSTHYSTGQTYFNSNSGAYFKYDGSNWRRISLE